MGASHWVELLDALMKDGLVPKAAPWNLLKTADNGSRQTRPLTARPRGAKRMMAGADAEY
jgi:hypothetical protein